MFPPDKTDNAEKWLTQLLESVGRAGLSFDPNVILDKSEQGVVEGRMRLTMPLAGGAWEALKSYVVSYSAATGWNITKMNYTARWLAIRASRA